VYRFAAIALVLAALSVPGMATTTIDTYSGWDGYSYIYPFGQPETRTYGQTFIAPAENVLTDFSFWLASDYLSVEDFKGYVMGWDGHEVTGTVLFGSDARTLAEGSDWTQFLFETGGLALTPGDAYVLMLSCPIDDREGTGIMAVSYDELYADGDFVHDNNYSWDELYTQWDNDGESWGWTGYDAAIIANFAPGLPIFALVGAAPLVGGLLRRFRRK